MKPPKNMGCIIAGIIVIVLAIGILFPTINDEPRERGRPQIQNDEMNMVNAIKAFYTEYGRYPTQNNEAMPVGGPLLAILFGKESKQNPRKIVFLEIPSARKTHGRWVSGLNPDTGTWVDPYGNPYLVKFDADYNGIIFNPYASDAAASKLPYPVIAWSSGKDGLFGNPKAPDQFQGSDDIISWR